MWLCCVWPGVCVMLGNGGASGSPTPPLQNSVRRGQSQLSKCGVSRRGVRDGVHISGGRGELCLPLGDSSPHLLRWGVGRIG